VFFFEPLKPILPADAQEMTCPSLLVKETMTLLNEAFTKAMPVASIFTTRFFVTLLFFAIF
jgi:hypothetical protein